MEKNFYYSVEKAYLCIHRLRKYRLRKEKKKKRAGKYLQNWFMALKAGSDPMIMPCACLEKSWLCEIQLDFGNTLRKQCQNGFRYSPFYS
ncbi:hypothetical protein CEXT_58311 [Caerostris extrusa]|uniref:Uncharacterized protein n=1 Tax=Caerostris extrusa TaxID=172846 RepID=A0AAV4S1R0_CAEEX|nr:hypothetical protein CEXT_58311 [Caerostris extrusa]